MRIRDVRVAAGRRADGSPTWDVTGVVYRGECWGAQSTVIARCDNPEVAKFIADAIDIHNAVAPHP